MMRFKTQGMVCFLICMSLTFHTYAAFIAERGDLAFYYERKDVVMIASTGRSGSTMLTKQIKKYTSKYRVLKTHLLPPSKKFKGKIIFIFSDPNQASESALYMTLHKETFAARHFKHLETADRAWLKALGGANNQTEQNNLLAYDALGIYEQLKEWLYTKTKPTQPSKAQILAVKYEDLWKSETIQALRDFLEVPDFQLPTQLPRGRQPDLFPQEIVFRHLYNLGTETSPRYAAYEEARLLWEQAPPFQYLKIQTLH